MVIELLLQSTMRAIPLVGRLKSFETNNEERTLSLMRIGSNLLSSIGYYFFVRKVRFYIKHEIYLCDGLLNHVI